MKEVYTTKVPISMCSKWDGMRKTFLKAFNELMGRNQSQNIQVEGKSVVTSQRTWLS